MVETWGYQCLFKPCFRIDTVIVTLLPPDQNTAHPNLTEERFSRLTVSSGFSSKTDSGAETAEWKGLVEDSCSFHGSQEAERAEDQRQERTLPGHPHSDPLPTWPHL